MKMLNKVKIRARELMMITRGLASTRHPILAHIVPMRRCNLSCAYCNEYDSVSKPVPLEAMKSRIDRLADLGTSIITISGGEPTLHPELDDIIRHIRSHGMIAGMITNGYFLTAERIERLNRRRAPASSDQYRQRPSGRSFEEELEGLGFQAQKPGSPR